jgi:hypothetical protein
MNSETIVGDWVCLFQKLAVCPLAVYLLSHSILTSKGKIDYKKICNASRARDNFTHIANL